MALIIYERTITARAGLTTVRMPRRSSVLSVRSLNPSAPYEGVVVAFSAEVPDRTDDELKRLDNAMVLDDDAIVRNLFIAKAGVHVRRLNGTFVGTVIIENNAAGYVYDLGEAVLEPSDFKDGAIDPNEELQKGDLELTRDIAKAADAVPSP